MLAKPPPDLKQKWKLTLNVSLLNIIAIPLLFIILGLIFGIDDIMRDLKQYANAHRDFFLPISKFNAFFWRSAIQPAFMEETRYRFLPWLILWFVYYCLENYG